MQLWFLFPHKNSRSADGEQTNVKHMSVLKISRKTTLLQSEPYILIHNMFYYSLVFIFNFNFYTNQFDFVTLSTNNFI
jgi:hypothetical protein